MKSINILDFTIVTTGLKFQLDRNSLEIIYTVFIRPKLEYGNEIWCNCTQYKKDDLGKIQTEAARIATVTTKLISIENLYSEIGWETLETRMKKQKLVLFYKIVQLLFPLLLLKLLVTILEMQMTSEHSTHELPYTTTLFYHLQSESGTRFPKNRVPRLLFCLSKPR